jgi:hypothetical protein
LARMHPDTAPLQAAVLQRSIRPHNAAPQTQKTPPRQLPKRGF